MTFSAREETIWLLDNELLMEIDTNSKRTRKTRHSEVQGDTGRNIFQIDFIGNAMFFTDGGRKILKKPLSSLDHQPYELYEHDEL